MRARDTDSHFPTILNETVYGDSKPSFKFIEEDERIFQSTLGIGSWGTADQKGVTIYLKTINFSKIAPRFDVNEHEAKQKALQAFLDTSDVTELAKVEENFKPDIEVIKFEIKPSVIMSLAASLRPLGFESAEAGINETEFTLLMPARMGVDKNTFREFKKSKVDHNVGIPAMVYSKNLQL